MTQRWVTRGDTGVGRLLWVFAVLSVVFLAILAVAPARSHFTEWRAVQQAYGRLAVAQGKEPLEPAIQQIWNPKLGAVDRCTSCHLGMGAAEAVAGDRLYASHPPIPHDPADYGCTLCHGGQGRATRQEAAHGHTRHWEEPLLKADYTQAGCGTCHTHLKLPSEEASRRGEALVRRYDCLACHRLEGAGRGSAPDLTSIGVRGLAADWKERHDARAPGETDPAWRVSWGPVPEPDREVIDAFLASRAGAPRLLEAKALAHRLGCRGCHRISGVGGDDGPDLTQVGRKLASDLVRPGDPKHWTLPQWLEEHFLDPASVVPGSQMPSLGLDRARARTLTLYMLSLRGVEVPEEYWPLDRIRGVRLGEREFSTDGESLFGVFCAGCHGPRGEGRRYGNMSVVFPAIGKPAFLALATDEYLRQTIVHGRPGRRMPAWGEKDGGLRPSEIDAIVRYLRSLAPGTPLPPAVKPPPGRPERGEAVYGRNCAGCHGPRGEGREAPALRNPAFLSAASDAYIASTVMGGRAGTSMRHFGTPTPGFATLELEEVADIIAWLRQPGEATGAAAAAPTTAKGSAQ